MELIQRNILSKVDVDGLDMTWGNEETVFEMIHKIAYRDGFGDILAEGTARASKKIGKNSDRYVMAIKKMEIGSSADPRASPRGWILGKLTSPRGGDNIRTTHMKADRMPSKSTLKEMGMTETDYTKWFISRLDMFDDTKSKIYGDPPKLSPYSFEGKPYLAKWFEDLYAALSALGVCIFPAGFVGMLGPTYYSKLLEACTGKKVSAKELMLVGERIFNLQRMYLAREGLTRKEDRFPSRFYREPLSGGPKNGATLSEEEVNKALDEYYEIRGWDPKTGHVTEAKIQELGLIEAVDRR
jgi:aldehyde:ferredoxin oxidoreductase